MSLDTQLAALPGDVALAGAFMSYAGPFPSQYREALAKDTWQKQVPCPTMLSELMQPALIYSICDGYGQALQLRILRIILLYLPMTTMLVAMAAWQQLFWSDPCCSQLMHQKHVLEAFRC